MTTAVDRNDLMPAQEKLEWVTPKISLMDAEDTEGSGKKTLNIIGECKTAGGGLCVSGPS
jgi:hypothetical protein